MVASHAGPFVVGLLGATGGSTRRALLSGRKGYKYNPSRSWFPGIVEKTKMVEEMCVLAGDCWR